MRIVNIMFGLVVVGIVAGGCGTQTDSSAPVHVINPPDNNTTPPDGNSTLPPDNNVTPPDDNSTIFDPTDALYDGNACNANYYHVASDASYIGELVQENGANFTSISEDGLWLRSDHLEADTSKKEKAWVYLYYKPFPDRTKLGFLGESSVALSGVFEVVYDLAWTDQNLSGLDNTLYVQSNKTQKPSCYRFTLDQINGSDINITKVYR